MGRLKEYSARLILFPRKSGQYKKLDGSKDEVEKAIKGDIVTAGKTRSILPVENVVLEKAVSEVKISDLPEGTKDAYRTLRTARSDARLIGVREKRAKAKADEAAATKK